MATDALAEVSQMNQKALKESNGTQANAFVSEMKASALFQFDWGELLSAAPTALALTGSCWVAAASEAADAIKMGNSVPIGGFKLPPCTKGERELENFKDALDDLADNARRAAVLATETREGFSKWGKMVGELHAATEHQQGHTSAERNETKAAENVAKIEQTFAVDAVAASKENVTHVTEQLKKAEKRLDTALDKVPGPWATVAQGAVTGFVRLFGDPHA
ncbi:MAG: hypothetical protein OHK93_008371 [Ramalina farinacea]|uniref:Uncharacterized protein n=1 Tax=Ramalina farinacea TaxID=258253 RepID=A0AA43TV10_9LECA|nr:hypothetical protein [Ramalina farinacea]